MESNPYYFGESKPGELLWCVHLDHPWFAVALEGGLAYVVPLVAGQKPEHSRIRAAFGIYRMFANLPNDQPLTLVEGDHSVRLPQYLGVTAAINDNDSLMYVVRTQTPVALFPVDSTVPWEPLKAPIWLEVPWDGMGPRVIAEAAQFWRTYKEALEKHPQSL